MINCDYRVGIDLLIACRDTYPKREVAFQDSCPNVLLSHFLACHAVKPFPMLGGVGRRQKLPVLRQILVTVDKGARAESCIQFVETVVQADRVGNGNSEIPNVIHSLA